MPMARYPKCENPGATCLWWDVGGVEYYDEFILYCKKCGYTESHIEYGGSQLSANWDTRCPFCGQDQLAHISELVCVLLKNYQWNFSLWNHRYWWRRCCGYLANKVWLEVGSEFSWELWKARRDSKSEANLRSTNDVFWACNCRCQVSHPFRDGISGRFVETGKEVGMGKTREHDLTSLA